MIDKTQIDILIGNDAALDDDGWALIAPFGEHPKTRTAKVNGVPTEQKFIQILDNASADALLAKENSLFRKIKRAIVGIPVYRGHPDLRDHAPETLGNGNAGRKEQIGVVDSVRKSAGGIQAHFILSPAGAAAVENDGCKFPSALWLVEPCGKRGDATLAKPFQLLSVGLTQNPNIGGVESLANAKTETQAEDKNMNREEVIGMLIGKGVALPNDVSDQQLLDILANGDYPGHPFHGNQYAESGQNSHASKASLGAHNATETAMKSGSSEDHKAAMHAHLNAAAMQAGKGHNVTAQHHLQMAEMHKSMAAEGGSSK